MIKNAIFQLQKLFSSKYIIKGKCKKCGECCKNIVFYINKTPIKTEEEFERLKKWKKKYNHFFISSVDEDGALLFTCKSLTKNNTCKDYIFRSINCRNYPKINNEFIINGGKPLENCGYRFDIDKKFSTYLESKL